MQVNYPNDHEYTRIVEIKYADGAKPAVDDDCARVSPKFRTWPRAVYPIPAPDARALYSKYAERAVLEKNVTFVGRLATYRYYNMDQVVGMALAEFDRLRIAREHHSAPLKSQPLT